HYRDGHFVCAEPLRCEALVQAQAITQPSFEGTRSCSGTRELENYSTESIASTVSYKSAELLLRSDANSIQYVHVLGDDRASARAFFVLLRRHSGATCSANHARQKLSAHDRILGLGRRIYHYGVVIGSVGSRGTSRYPNITNKPIRRDIKGTSGASNI